jgi:tRNA dimethylallyltransferase
LDETRRLAERYGWDVPAMSGLGYAQLGAYLRGEMTLDEAVAAIQRETRRFVRRQANWFKSGDPAIHWFDVVPTDGTQAAEPERTVRAIEQFVYDWLVNPSL